MNVLQVGQKYRRRQLKDDEWDRLIIRGHFECGVNGELVELVVSPADSFGTPVTTTAESLIAAYTLDTDDPAAEVEAVARKLEAWETAPEELANG